MLVNNAGVLIKGNNFPMIPKMVTGELVNNEVTSRRELLKSLLDPRRDINAECGYPETETISVKDYRQMYERESVGTRVVEIEPMESWQIKPEVYEDEDEEVETDFELSWLHVCDNLNQESEEEDRASWFEAEPKTHPIWEYLKRVDVLSGIGHFGVLLIGIDDGKDLKEPIEGFASGAVTYNAEEEPAKDPPKMPFKAKGKEDPKDAKEPKEEAPKEPPETKYKLLYLRAFDEDLVEVNTYETDKENPRFGQPTMYTLTINDPLNNHQSGIGINTQSIQVHWSRVIHVADNIGSSELFSAPRMRAIWNRLLDLRKIYGSSGEGYWQGAFPGISLETHPQLGGDVTIDAASTRKAMYDYTNSLQRYIALSGITAKTLSAQIVDPNPQISACIDAICIKIKCPKRIFLGSERGELSSNQDQDTWDNRIKARREDYLTHRLIVPFVNRLIRIGVLAEPKTGFKVDWEQEQVETAAEKATTAKTITEALVAYISGGVDALMEPLDYLVRIVGIPADEAEEILDNAVEHINKANPDLDDVEVAGKQPKEPEPPPQEFPIKVRDGEHLFSPDGTKKIGSAPPVKKLTKNAGAKQETMGEFGGDDLLAVLEALPIPESQVDAGMILNVMDHVNATGTMTPRQLRWMDNYVENFVSAAQRRWWFATRGGKGGSAGKGGAKKGGGGGGAASKIQAASPALWNHSPAAVSRALGQMEGWTVKDALAVMRAKGVDVSENTVKTQFYRGKGGAKDAGKAATLDASQIADLNKTRDALRNGMPVLPPPPKPAPVAPKPVAPVPAPVVAKPVTPVTPAGPVKKPDHITHTGEVTELTKKVWAEVNELKGMNPWHTEYREKLVSIGKHIGEEVDRRYKEQSLKNGGRGVPQTQIAMMTRDVIREVRDLGNHQVLLKGGIDEVNAMLRVAETSFPTDWLKNVRSVETDLTIRGYFIPRGVGEGKIALSRISNPEAFKRVAHHEWVHAFEHTNSNLKLQQAKFLEERQKPGHKLTKDSGEVYAKDSLPDEYTGRIYDPSQKGTKGFKANMHYEVLSTALEDLLTGSKAKYVKADQHLEHFAFGALVSL